MRGRSFIVSLCRSRLLRWGLPVVLLLAIGYAYVSYAMAAGVTTPDRSSSEEHPTDYGLPYADLAFAPRGGEWEELVLRGWLLDGGGPGDGPTVIVVHGLNSNRAGDNALALADRLLDFDLNVLLFDLRGHGESDGEQVSAGYFEKWDVLGAYDYLVQEGAPPGSIGVLGFSMGGATALQAAALEPGIRAAVADSAFADVRDMIAQETARTTIFPKWMVPLFIPGMSVMSSVLYGIDVGAIVPEDAASTLDYPILVIHGDADSRIPPEQSVRIHASALSGSELWLSPGSEHADTFFDAQDEYIERVEAYYGDRLAGQR